MNRSIAVVGSALVLMLSACVPASTAAPSINPSPVAVIVAPASTAAATINPSPAAINTTQASVTPASTVPANTATATPTDAPSSVPTQTPSSVPTATSAASSAPAGLPDSESTPAGIMVATMAPPQASKNTVKGQPTRIVLPTLHVDSKVIPVGWTTVIQGNQLVSDWETADYAVGFHFTAAPPGTVGNTVMSGHNNINGAVFRDLDLLKVGDKITVYAGDKMFQYAISQTMIVEEKFASAEQRQKNAQWIAPTNDNRLTLISCWPRTNNTHRVIVVAKPA